jgi:hypothetical protein
LSLNVPPLNGFPQVLVPEYEATILELVTLVAVPLMEKVQIGLVPVAEIE